VGQARAAGHPRPADRAVRPQPRDELDPDRLGGRPGDGAAVSGAAFGQLPASGQWPGSVSSRAYLAELPSLVAEITAGTIAVTATTMPLADLEQIWPRAEAPGERIVLVP
jgi:hypothetical protein